MFSAPENLMLGGTKSKLLCWKVVETELTECEEKCLAKRKINEFYTIFHRISRKIVRWVYVWVCFWQNAHSTAERLNFSFCFHINNDLEQWYHKVKYIFYEPKLIYAHTANTHTHIHTHSISLSLCLYRLCVLLCVFTHLWNCSMRKWIYSRS